MRDRSPVSSNPDLSVTTLPTAGDELKVQSVLAGIPPGSPKELSVVHDAIPAHMCATFKVVSCY